MAKKRRKNRRKHARARLEMVVSYRKDSLEQFVTDHSKDLSCGGIFLATDSPRPEGSEIYFQFTARDRGPLIVGLGRVVRVADKDSDTGAGMGLEFLSLDERSRELVDQVVAERLRVASAEGAAVVDDD